MITPAAGAADLAPVPLARGSAGPEAFSKLPGACWPGRTLGTAVIGGPWALGAAGAFRATALPPLAADLPLRG